MHVNAAAAEPDGWRTQVHAPVVRSTNIQVRSVDDGLAHAAKACAAATNRSYSAYIKDAQAWYAVLARRLQATWLTADQQPARSAQAVGIAVTVV